MPRSADGGGPDGAPILITMGEPAGIGPEVALAAYATLGGKVKGHPLKLVGDPSVFGATDAPVIATKARARRSPGHPDPANGAAVTEAIEIAATACLRGTAAAMVTAPIHKAVLAQAGFPHPGHTEFLGELTGARRAVMMLASDRLRVVPLTIHMPIAQVPAAITRQAVFDTGEIVLTALRHEFGVIMPNSCRSAWRWRVLTRTQGKTGCWAARKNA